MGERKMLICRHDAGDAPDGAASAIASPAISTFPSAGDKTSLPVAVEGAWRSGSRKKNAKNSPKRRKGAANSHPLAAPASAASTSVPTMNGKPAESIRKVTGAARRD